MIIKNIDSHQEADPATRHKEIQNEINKQCGDWPVKRACQKRNFKLIEKCFDGWELRRRPTYQNNIREEMCTWKTFFFSLDSQTAEIRLLFFARTDRYHLPGWRSIRRYVWIPPALFNKVSYSCHEICFPIFRILGVRRQQVLERAFDEIDERNFRLFNIHVYHDEGWVGQVWKFFYVHLKKIMIISLFFQKHWQNYGLHRRQICQLWKPRIQQSYSKLVTGYWIVL